MPEIFVNPFEDDVMVVGETVITHQEKATKITLENAFFDVKIYNKNARVLPVFGAICFLDKPQVLGKIKLTAFADGKYSLTYKKANSDLSNMPVLHTSTNFFGNNVVGEVCLQDTVLITFSSDAESQTIRPKKHLTDIKLMFQPTKSTLLCVVSANSDKKYLAVCGYDGVFRMLYEGEADNYEFSDDSFVETTCFNDLLGRKRTACYTFTERGFTSTWEKFSYNDVSGYDFSILPSLLLEATIAADFETANKYLGENLKGKAAYLPEFFGAFDRYERLSESTYAIYDDSPEYGLITPKILQFDFVGHTIDNIAIKD